MNNKKKYELTDGKVKEIFWLDDDQYTAIMGRAVNNGNITVVEVKPLKGMTCEVYASKSIGDCTNGGISSKYNTLTLVGDGVPEIFEETEDRPAIFLRQHMGDYIAVPKTEKWTMMGGNFLYSCDSRFRQLVSGSPIRIHDRIEG
jgi:hypothetical protein